MLSFVFWTPCLLLHQCFRCFPCAHVSCAVDGCLHCMSHPCPVSRVIVRPPAGRFSASSHPPSGPALSLHGGHAPESAVSLLSSLGPSVLSIASLVSVQRHALRVLLVPLFPLFCVLSSLVLPQQLVGVSASQGKASGALHFSSLYSQDSLL